MKSKKRGKLFRFCLFFWRLFSRRFRVRSSNENVTPAVYLVHHQNLKGPLISMAWFDKPVRLWVLSVFYDRIECFRQYFRYTFTKRFGWPKFLSAIVTAPLSIFVPALMKSMDVIPVFRGSRNIVKTFSQSIDALLGGENLLISPDIEYANKNSKIGQMYDGFLYLEKFYVKKTGRHIPYIPLCINWDTHCIIEGNPVYFAGCDDFKTGKAKVYERLRQEFSRLESL